MYSRYKSCLFLLVAGLFLALNTNAQNPINWTTKQLMEPRDLAAAIKANPQTPLVISVGPGAVIPGSFDAGMAGEEEGLKKLKAKVKDLPKDKQIVVYCGCCPFEHCPNVRPAINALKEMNFTNYYLLNIPDNIKKDWIDKGYPVAEKP